MNSLKHIVLLCLKNFRKGDFLTMLSWLQKPNLKNSSRRSLLLNFHSRSKAAAPFRLDFALVIELVGFYALKLHFFGRK